ncbi:MAG: hypothetical protein ABSA67_18505 [Candidatus Brocadiia bacterium]
MNATEHIVELYFRICRKCFTMRDVKVLNGNNRQIDLLAYSVLTQDQYHIEVGVTHCPEFCSSAQGLTSEFDAKFFGKPPQRKGKNTDYAKGKTYEKKICDTYASVGFTPEKVQCIWCCWIVPNASELDGVLQEYAKTSKHSVTVLSFRDEVLPELQNLIGTSNYEDEVLRTLSLLHQQLRQTTKSI